MAATDPIDYHVDLYASPPGPDECVKDLFAGLVIIENIDLQVDRMLGAVNELNESLKVGVAAA